MKIVTFNIRCDYGQDKENNFSFRKPLIQKKLNAEAPDLICFQEVLPHVAIWLKQSLPAYNIIGCGRSETLEDEQVSIAYRKDRINLMQMETYWLSETPMIPASRYPDQSICPRTCTEAVFEELATKKIFRIVNTHLDHEGTGARKKGLQQILRKLESNTFFPNIPTIVAGDMNAWPDSEEIAVMKTALEFTNLTEGIGITYHGYGKTEYQESIDYIFAKGFIVEKPAKKWMDEENGVYLSDHYPVCVEVR